MVRSRDCHNDYNEPFLGVIRWRTNQPNLSWGKTHHSATWVSGYLIFILSQMFPQNSIIINQLDLNSSHHHKSSAVDQFMKFLFFKSWCCFTQTSRHTWRWCYSFSFLLFLSFFLEMLVPPLKPLADDPRPPVACWHSGGHTKSDNSIFYPPLLISTPSNDLLPTPANRLISATSRLGSPSQRFWTPHNLNVPSLVVICWTCPGSERCPAENAPVV